MIDGDAGARLTAGQALERVELLLAVGQVRSAKELASKVLAADPDSAEGRILMSRVLMAEDEPEEALVALRGALAKEPDHDTAHFLMGLNRVLTGRWSAAERSYLKAIELDPGHAGYRAAYARLLDLLDFERDALRVVEDALALDPDDPDLHALRSRLMLVVDPRHWRLSEESALRAVRLDPENPDARAALGMVRLRSGDLATAEEDFRSALRLHPGDRLARHGLILALKSRNPFYRPMLWFSTTISRLGHTWQLGVLLGLWLLGSGLAAVLESPLALPEAANGVRLTYLALCAYTWFADPITQFLLARRYPWIRSPGSAG